MLIQRSF